MVLPERTAEVLRDVWYITGDIALIDGEGFLRITTGSRASAKSPVKWFHT